MNTNYLKVRQLVPVILAILWSFNLSAQSSYLIEAESFQFHGKWILERSGECSGGAMLRVYGGGSKSSELDAITVLAVQESGQYSVWVRAADNAQSSGSRLLQVSVDEKPMAESGRHGKTGFFWERVGNVELSKKEILLRIHDTKRNYGRCDAIFLTKDEALDPNQMSLPKIAQYKKSPVEMPTQMSGLKYALPPLALRVDAPIVASVENEDIRLSFVKAGANDSAIACRTEIKTKGFWRGFLGAIEDHKVFLLTAEDSPIDNDAFYPGWKNGAVNRKFEFDGKQYKTPLAADFMNPYMSGEMSDAIPKQAKVIDSRTIEVKYVTLNGSTIIGVWRLPKKGSHIEVALRCTAATKGMYSVGIAAFQSVPDTYLTNVLLPPMFQYKRIPRQPVMMLSSMMQQLMAITESKTVQGEVSSFVCADLSSLPKDWGSYDYSPMGFAIKNERDEVQPVAFSPVMGMRDSQFNAGDEFERRFIIGVVPSSWNSTLEYISDNLFGVKDYRKQQDVSLTDAMFNIVDLMRDKEYGGWNPALKGFYDIEGDPKTAPTVVHSAPLAIIAAAITSGDEDFYISHALPTIEYTLSRKGYRWATDIVPSGYNRTPETLRFNPLRSQFTTSYYEGLDFLLGRKNPWLRAIALPGDSLRQSNGYSTRTLSWVQAISAYRMTGEQRWLNFATTTAKRYIATNIYQNNKLLVGDMSFYNSIAYSIWWDLIDLYEITNDKIYLDAAQYGAAHTLAGICTYPAIDNGTRVIHKGNRYDGNTNLWWKGTERYRLGFPRTDGDVQQKSVEDWLVSPVGLGFEQPSTYFIRTKGKQTRPVFMSNWAPHLLRLAKYTQKPIYEIYARNSVIGRFKNYPGYYATGFSDITMAEDFPYKGPDVSSIYYHHLPPHLAFTWDYLVTEAINRSAGNVSFPYCKQEGFVWFANRIYGSEAGQIFGDTNARLLMKRDLIKFDNASVNYITAVSDKNFWVMLCNESDTESKLSLDVANVPNLALEGNALLYSEKGSIGKAKAAAGKIDVAIPAKGFRAISLPLSATAAKNTTVALNDGMKIIDMGQSAGKVFVFRIRSPFGWDSIYCFAETSPVKDKNITMEVTCNDVKQSISKYPFECSFMKLTQDEDAKVRISIAVDADKEIVKEITLTSK